MVVVVVLRARYITAERKQAAELRTQEAHYEVCSEEECCGLKRAGFI